MAAAVTKMPADLPKGGAIETSTAGGMDANSPNGVSSTPKVDSVVRQLPTPAQSTDGTVDAADPVPDPVPDPVSDTVTVSDPEATPVSRTQEDAGTISASGSSPKEKTSSPDDQNSVKPSSKSKPRTGTQDAAVESEDDSDDGDNYVSSFTRERMMVMGYQGIYDVLTSKLEAREERKSAPAGVKETKGQASALVTGLVDYLRVLERRIKALERKPAEDETETKPAKDKDDDESVAGDKSDEGSVKDKEEEVTKSKEDIAAEELAEDERRAKPTFHDYQDEDDLLYNKGSLERSSTYTKTSFAYENSTAVLQVLFRWTAEKPAAPAPDEGGSEPQAPGPDSIEVLGIRINSKPIAAFFKSLAKVQIDHRSTTMFSKPFRFLVRNAAAIEAHYDTLDSDEVFPGPLTEDGKGPEESREAQQERLHFKALVDFINVYLHKQRSLYNAYRDSKKQQVAFENLWMLFDHGDTIYCDSRRGEEKIQVGEDTFDTVARYTPQAYRVVGTAGGIGRARFFVPSGQPAANAAKKPPNTPAKRGALKSEPSRLNEVGTRIKDRFSPLYIDTFFVDYDGSRLSTVAETFRIRPFEDEVAVTSLEVYPLEYLEAAKRKKLATRGDTFLDYTHYAALVHKGLTAGEIREELSGPVMVDITMAIQVDNDLAPVFSAPNRLLDFADKESVQEVPKSTHSTTDYNSTFCCLNDQYIAMERTRAALVANETKAALEELDPRGDEKTLAKMHTLLQKEKLSILLPGVVHGFALHDRKWFLLDIWNLKPVEPPSKASGWKRLVLPPSTKDLVESMVTTHTAKQPDGSNEAAGNYDTGLVPGKGKGCIILLHGVPGVGKTSTAECVAAVTERPLFPITCGDLGSDPEAVEKSLSRLFRLAHRWRCVLLLDEADVFLAERDKGDVKRNGLVSVFLRMLEYYSGILFLTTNRVGGFDEAFRSRIHLTLYYPPLTKKQSLKIWEMNLKKLAEVNNKREDDGFRPIEFRKDRILEHANATFKQYQWNGRQIHNAFQTAQALAEYEQNHEENPKKRRLQITVEHFAKIGETTVAFDEYLRDTLKHDWATRQQRRQLRADRHGTKEHGGHGSRHESRRDNNKKSSRPSHHKPGRSRRADDPDSESEEDSEDYSLGESDEESESESPSRHREQTRSKSKRKPKRDASESPTRDRSAERGGGGGGGGGNESGEDDKADTKKERRDRDDNSRDAGGRDKKGGKKDRDNSRKENKGREGKRRNAESDGSEEESDGRGKRR